ARWEGGGVDQRVENAASVHDLEQRLLLGMQCEAGNLYARLAEDRRLRAQPRHEAARVRHVPHALHDRLRDGDFDFDELEAFVPPGCEADIAEVPGKD